MIIFLMCVCLIIKIIKIYLMILNHIFSLIQGTKIQIKLVLQVNFVVLTVGAFLNLIFVMGITTAATGLTKANAVRNFPPDSNNDIHT